MWAAGSRRCCSRGLSQSDGVIAEGGARGRGAGTWERPRKGVRWMMEVWGEDGGAPGWRVGEGSVQEPRRGFGLGESEGQA